MTRCQGKWVTSQQVRMHVVSIGITFCLSTHFGLIYCLIEYESARKTVSIWEIKYQQTFSFEKRKKERKKEKGRIKKKRNVFCMIQHLIFINQSPHRETDISSYRCLSIRSFNSFCNNKIRIKANILIDINFFAWKEKLTTVCVKFFHWADWSVKATE